MYTKVSDGNGGRRVWKKKFMLALISLFVGYGFLAYIVSHVDSWMAGDIGTFLGALTTFTLGVLGPIYAADIADKKLNGGKYNDGASS